MQEEIVRKTVKELIYSSILHTIKVGGNKPIFIIDVTGIRCLTRVEFEEEPNNVIFYAKSISTDKEIRYTLKDLFKLSISGVVGIFNILNNYMFDHDMFCSMFIDNYIEVRTKLINDYLKEVSKRGGEFNAGTKLSIKNEGLEDEYIKSGLEHLDFIIEYLTNKGIKNYTGVDVSSYIEPDSNTKLEMIMLLRAIVNNDIINNDNSNDDSIMIDDNSEEAEVLKNIEEEMKE